MHKLADELYELWFTTIIKNGSILIVNNLWDGSRVLFRYVKDAIGDPFFSFLASK